MKLTVSPETDRVLFREGEAPAEPRRDGSAIIVATLAPEGTNPRNPNLCDPNL